MIKTLVCTWDGFKSCYVQILYDFLKYFKVPSLNRKINNPYGNALFSVYIFTCLSRPFSPTFSRDLWNLIKSEFLQYISVVKVYTYWKTKVSNFNKKEIVTNLCLYVFCFIKKAWRQLQRNTYNHIISMEPAVREHYSGIFSVLNGDKYFKK